ncbi:recombinase family protein [Nonomuraea sp. NPDC004580]|uniref:recombinase family protein n=1 Tax=Nonomuraea sp. NPDC004580 TaxID=3154552 RepID=UPI0033A48029
MKLSEWARRNGVHYQTAWKWARDGTMPVPVVKTATGRYLVLEQPAGRDGRAVAYRRVSSAEQKADLERQAGRVVTAATGMGLTITAVVTEVGSGLNGERPNSPGRSACPAGASASTARGFRYDADRARPLSARVVTLPGSGSASSSAS